MRGREAHYRRWGMERWSLQELIVVPNLDQLYLGCGCASVQAGGLLEMLGSAFGERGQS